MLQDELENRFIYVPSFNAFYKNETTNVECWKLFIPNYRKMGIHQSTRMNERSEEEKKYEEKGPNQKS